MTESTWIGPGTWLTRQWAGNPQVGVVTNVTEQDGVFDARLSIYWRPNSYQNTSLLLALERLRDGRWEVDDV